MASSKDETSTPSRAKRGAQDKLTLLHGSDSQRKPKNAGPLYTATVEVFKRLPKEMQASFADAYQLCLLISLAAEVHHNSGDISRCSWANPAWPSLTDIPLALNAAKRMTRVKWVQETLSLVLGRDALDLGPFETYDELYIFTLLKDTSKNAATFERQLTQFRKGKTEREPELSQLYHEYVLNVQAMAESGHFALAINEAAASEGRVQGARRRLLPPEDDAVLVSQAAAAKVRRQQEALERASKQARITNAREKIRSLTSQIEEWEQFIEGVEAEDDDDDLALYDE
jgi:hypothetical protein